MDYSVLKNEISQPQYAGMSDLEISNSLNAPNRNIRIPSGGISGSTLVSTFSAQDLAALTEKQLFQLLVIVSPEGGVLIGADSVNTTLKILFPGLSPETVAAIDALKTRAGSRSEELFGPNVQVDVNDIKNSRGLK